MAQRKILIVPGEVYHVFNRGVGEQPLFLSARDYQRVLDTIRFYRFEKPSIRFSFYNRLSEDEKQKFSEELLQKGKPIVEIFCFCLMPNHVHFLLRNMVDRGISQFMGNFQNSYAKYFNTKNERTGTLFQQNFKAVRIESDEQLIHVSRYIHLNPVTAYLIRLNSLEEYKWSSYPDYLGIETTFVQKDFVLSNFKSSEEYKRFLLDQVDYQKILNRIKHLMLE